ncbi:MULTISPECIES: XRE family transcriptional regulator [Bacteroidota]|uniref:XRE family transcriptional regulator n=1 Tax=Bacteroidota TaxID=976 RepID=UPI001C96098C|nr:MULTISPECIES: LexA family transcriptional regulator [Bacteroidota]
MNTQKIYFFSNLRFLRNRRKITQEQVSAALGMHRIKYTNLENGKTKSPNMEELLKLSRFYRLSIDTLLQIDLSKIGELKLRELENGDDVYIKGGNLRVLAISIDKSNNENIEYVPVSAKMGYSSGGFADQEFIEKELQRFSMPDMPGTGTFRFFRGQGDSMLPIPDGSVIAGEYVTDWFMLKKRTPAIVVLSFAQDIVFKMVTVQEDGNILLESTNSLYEPYLVPINEVAEIWKFYSFTSRQMPEPQTDLEMVLSEIRNFRSEVVGK